MGSVQLLWVVKQQGLYFFISMVPADPPFLWYKPVMRISFFASSFAENGVHLIEMCISTYEIYAEYVFLLRKNYPKCLRINSALLGRSTSGS